MDDDVFRRANQQAALCKVFGSSTRILIFWALGEGEMSVSEIADTIQASLQNTSQHLRLMRERGILTARRDGHSTYYRISEGKWRQGCELLNLAAQNGKRSPTY